MSSGVERCRGVSSGVERCRGVSRCRVWHLDTVEHGFSLDGVEGCRGVSRGVEGCRVGRVGMGCRGVESVSRFGVEVSRPGLRQSHTVVHYLANEVLHTPTVVLHRLDVSRGTGSGPSIL